PINVDPSSTTFVFLQTPQAFCCHGSPTGWRMRRCLRCRLSPFESEPYPASLSKVLVMATTGWSPGPSSETFIGSSPTTATSSISSGWRTRSASTATNLEPCPECGAPVGGRDACQKLFDDLGLRAFEDSYYAAMRRLTVDCYACQHDRYILSGRSLAARLTGLPVAIG